ncbi:unnamed protein product [Dracunculus medinensis]|uniref:ATP-synt_C domain-containing protein n=1 Tax=Dracunculus medinensis TaxID=318479 RepID=A0A0N4UJ42_DRAME|nr:unnamed protein product [Dracunculus medinensis]
MLPAIGPVSRVSSIPIAPTSCSRIRSSKSFFSSVPVGTAVGNTLGTSAGIAVGNPLALGTSIGIVVGESVASGTLVIRGTSLVLAFGASSVIGVSLVLSVLFATSVRSLISVVFKDSEMKRSQMAI